MLITACTPFHQSSYQRLNGTYYERIKDWQQRIKKYGWSENLIDEVMDQILQLATFRTEYYDHWDTPQEFMRRGFRGDCEDIAIFMMATLKRLKYPDKVRVMAVETLKQDHAVLKVQTPNGKWKIYDTLQKPLSEINRLFYKPIFEFDENDIIYYERKIT